MRLRGDEVDSEIVIQLSGLSKSEARIRSGLIGVITDRGYADAVPVLIKQIKDENSYYGNENDPEKESRFYVHAKLKMERVFILAQRVR